MFYFNILIMARIKSFYKDSTDGAWKANGRPMPNGQFMGVYERTSYFTLVHPATVGNKPIFEPTLVTEIEKEDGTTYADKAEFELAIGSFFLRASGTGSGGGIIESTHIFASDTARNTYFSTDPNHEELLPGLSIISGSEIQRWAAVTPAAATDYVGTNFVDITGASLTGAQIKALLFALNNTNNLDDAKLSILNLLTEQSDRVVSSKSFEFPPDTVFVSENLGLQGASEAFAVWDRANNRRGYLIAYLRGVDEKPFYRNLDSFATDVEIQGVKTSNSPSDTFTESISITENRLITKVYLESPNNTTGASIKVLRGGHVVAEALNVSFVANTVKEIEIPQGIFVRRGSTIQFEVDGVTLKGNLDGGTFSTFLRIDSFLYSEKAIASEDFVNSNPGNISQAERDKLAGISEGAEVNTQSDWNESNNTSDSYIKNKPTIPVSRTNEEIQDIIDSTLVAGSGISLVYNDVANTLTIMSTNEGGGTNPPASADIIYFGLSGTNNPETVDISTLTTESDPTNPDTISSGLATQGQFFILLVPSGDDVTSIFDTVLNQDVTSLFTKTTNIRTLNSETYNSYVIGPLNAGFNEQYVINF